MSTRGEFVHQWAQKRLGAWAAGLLDAESADSVEKHIAECDSCRSTADTLRHHEFPEDSWGQHVPASVLASWSDSAPKLRGALRKLIRQHLERCELCRAELVTLGFRAELELDPALEEPEAEAGKPLLAQGRRGVPFGPKLLPSWAWATGLAAAAAVVVVMQVGMPRLAMRGERRSPPGEGPPVAGNGVSPPMASLPIERPPGGPPKQHPAPNRPVLLALGPESGAAIGLRELRRGGEAAGIPEVALSEPDSKASFRLPGALALFPLEAQVQVAVVDSSGRYYRTFRTSIAELYPSGSPLEVVLHQGEPPLVPGRYSLVFNIETAGQAEQRSYEFRVR